MIMFAHENIIITIANARKRVYLKSNITLTALRRTVDFKSIMGVMALGIYSGTTIEIKCEGKDEQEAMDAIADTLVKQGLGKEL